MSEIKMESTSVDSNLTETKATRSPQIGDRVKVVKAQPGDESLLGLEGVVSRYGILFPLEVTLDEPVEIDGEVFNELMLFEDEVEKIDA